MPESVTTTAAARGGPDAGAKLHEATEAIARPVRS